MNWNNLKFAFSECFDEENYSFRSEEDNFIWAAPKEFLSIDNRDKFIHYELVKRGDLYFVEFHIESNFYPEVVDKLHEIFNRNENLRRWHFDTYYSSKMWRTRTPAFSCEDVKNDVTDLKNLFNLIDRNSSNTEKKKETMADKLNKYHCFTIKLPEIAKSDEIKIPNVQRGFVWNPARCATLWDSILRGFPIGAICLQLNGEDMDLLDGQQRLTVIKLAFSEFPPKVENKKQSILWIDLGESNCSEKKFAFKVTTASQPWGYKDANKETENPKLSIQERREAVKGYWEDDTKAKPYPFELFPFYAKIPVPFTLLREWLETEKAEKTFAKFKDFCKNNEELKNNNWLRFVGDKQPENSYWENVKTAIEALNNYDIVVTNANNVAQEDIALFFSRVGRGGVIPTEEEIAYSILKSKIGGDFKSNIETIAKENGCAPEHRIANLAIRYFCSDKGQLCRTSVFDEVQKLCNKPEQKKQFIDFIKVKFGDDFNNLIKKLKSAKLKVWHISRYCNYANGDIFLYLLCELRDSGDIDQAIRVAEYVHCFSSDPGQVLSKIRKDGLKNGIIASLAKTYYGKQILNTPIAPSFFETIALDSFDKIGQWLHNPCNSIAVDLLRSGYDNPHMYSILLFACRKALPEFDPNLDEWKDENCPWDYDHILPQKWFDKMNGQNVCVELKNSIGNLAPLDFSLNRSLSDDDRPETYPAKESNQGQSGIQEQLCIEKLFKGYQKDKFANNKDNHQLYFCQTTIQRFIRIYKNWYDCFSLNFNKIIENSFRYQLFQKIIKEISDVKLQIYYVDGELQYEIKDNCNEINLNWLRPWVAVGFEVNYNGDANKKCLLSIASDGNTWEVGYRRHPLSTEVNGDSNRWWFDDCKVFDTPNEAKKEFTNIIQKRATNNETSDF